MRINLVTPFAEKDAAKALGARWDATKKVWYVKDVADLTAFMRWIPDLQAATENPAAGTAQPTTNPLGARAQQSRGVATTPTRVLPHCGCNVLPWDDCEHTASQPAP